MAGQKVANVNNGRVGTVLSDQTVMSPAIVLRWDDNGAVEQVAHQTIQPVRLSVEDREAAKQASLVETEHL